ncbi:hypothetical protein GCM10009868_06430 [Terrabacter aerolatus]|uniref:Muconolactone isomerase domain-containing protein n=1 Tax=Terrabacter aerolatus TaxID=422442 RepID=A0A512D1L4_9MICO|nr:hypothetical protein [Terrabacter aerolatus]GEO30150.1 hypothetical protein TAE01_19600 [Terrabacter aerolatus]
MKVLAISSNIGDTSALLADEAAEVDDLVRRGIALQVLVKADWSGAALLLEVPDLETARATVVALPIAAHGLTRFELTPVVEVPTPGSGDAGRAAEPRGHAG